MRQRHLCISHGSNVDHNALRSWHTSMYKFVTSIVHCGLGMQQCAMHNATIQKATFFELGVYVNVDYGDGKGRLGTARRGGGEGRRECKTLSIIESQAKQNRFPPGARLYV